MSTSLHSAPEPEASPPNTGSHETVPKQTLHRVLVFNKPNGYIEIDLGVSRLNGNFTIEAWVYPTSASGAMVIYSEGDSAFYLENNQLKFQKYTTKETISSANGSITLNSWNHVAVTKLGNKAGETKLYINSKQNDNQALISKLTSNKRAYIGIQNNFTNKYFQGKISDVRIWNRTLSQDEIEKNWHNRLIGNEPGLMGYWTVSEGSGSIAHDKTQNAKNGTIHNVTWGESMIPITDEADPKEPLLNSTKVEDYKYLYSKSLKSQPLQSDVPFLRGRIWS